MSGETIGLVPRLGGLGGMVSFQARLMAGLEARGVATTFDLADPRLAAILIIGGTRHVGALWQARRRGVRLVQRLNGMNWLHRRQKTSLKGFLRAEGNNRLLAFIRRSLAHRIVYQSSFSRDWWNRVFGTIHKPQQVTYNGIDLSRATPAGPGERPADRLRLLLVEGHLSADNRQGLDNALALARALRENHRLPVELTVAGDVPESIRAACPAELPVTWAGVLKRDEILTLDRSSHLLFSGDLNAACPNSVIEALACGLPVAAYDTGALAEMVQGGAGCVAPYGADFWKLEPPQVAPLAEASAGVLQNQPAYRAAARARAEAVFGLETMLEGYLEALLG